MPMARVAPLVGGQVLRLGMSGPLVVAIQRALAELGYPLKGTGYYGSATDTAVSAFQKRAGLRDDGQVGPKTAKALDDARPAGHPVIPMQDAARPLWLEVGLALLGTKEAAGSADNQTILQWAHDEGGDIARDYTHDVIPWCALLTNHQLTKAGLKGTETLWALDFNSDRMRRRIGHGWPAIKLAGPAVGAIAPMLRNGGGHVITVAGRDQHGNVMGLGGNQSDKVSILPFPLSRLNEGFWWPDSVPLPTLIGFDTLPLVLSDGRVSSREA